MCYVSWVLDNRCTNVQKIPFEKARSRSAFLKFTRAIGTAIVYRLYITSYLCNAETIYHVPCQEITTFTVQVTACDLEKSFTFNTTLKTRNLSSCIDLHTHANMAFDNLWPFDLGVNACRATAMHCMCSKCGVDSSSHFSSKAQTHTHKSQMSLLTLSTHMLPALWVTARHVYFTDSCMASIILCSAVLIENWLVTDSHTDTGSQAVA